MVKPRALEKGLSLDLDVAPSVPAHVVADPARIRQVLVNLLGNSVKFTHKGGVTLTADAEMGEGSACVLRFRVTDTGIGVPREKHHLLFQTFTQADSSTTRKYGGTGLGLAICKRLVELMGGRIWFDSEEGEGTVFQFTVGATAT